MGWKYARYDEFCVQAEPEEAFFFSEIIANNRSQVRWGPGDQRPIILILEIIILCQLFPVDIRNIGYYMRIKPTETRTAQQFPVS